MTHRLFFWGSFFGCIGVASGAFAAHWLTSRLTVDLLKIFETGVRYQMYHAFALLATSWAGHLQPESRLIPAAGLFFISGIVLFSGSLYLLALTGLRWLGAVTPIGGTAFIIGWILLMVAVRPNR